MKSNILFKILGKKSQAQGKNSNVKKKKIKFLFEGGIRNQLLFFNTDPHQNETDGSKTIS